MKIIGRKDKVDFPDLLLTNVAIKVDTGAYSSTIHCVYVEEKLIDDVAWIYYKLLDPAHPLYNDHIFRTTEFKRKKVKNSFGKSELRYFITTRIVIFDEEFSIELSLSERSKMRSPVLLGRKILKGRYLVDTTKQNLSYKEKRLNKNKEEQTRN